MAKGWRLEKWNGREVLDELRRAQVAAVDETIQAAAEQANAGRSGRAAAVQVVQAAQDTGSGARGEWGVPPEPHGDPFWELFVEVGTAYQPGDGAKRAAADQQYAQLADRIRGHYGAG